MLFVPENWIVPLADALHSIRAKHGYFKEIHWREISSASSKSPRFLVARDWIEHYLRFVMPGCPFKAFIAEDGPNRRLPYPGDPAYPEHLLVSTKAALKAGVAWSFYRESKLLLDLVFDDSDNELDRSVADQVPTVLQSECNTSRLKSTKRYPWLRVSPVRFLSSDPRKVDDLSAAPYCEFIQLCDLLLDASFQALQL